MLKIKIVSALILMLISTGTLAQETFIMEGDTLQLTREVDGPLSLFFTEEAFDFRYFVQKEDRMLELKKEKVDGVPQYKFQLKELTDDTDISVADVKFALYSLKHFANLYNAKVKEDYEYNNTTENIQERIGFFTGISNNVYADNPEDILAPVIGVEFELHDPNLAPRHSAFLHLRQSLKREEFRYASTQLSINYRYKFLRLRKLNFHVDVELANLMYSKSEMDILNDGGEIVEVREDSGFSFTAPLSFGVGSDIRITENGYITLSYNDVVSIVLDSNGNFPVDFTIGYKYEL